MFGLETSISRTRLSTKPAVLAHPAACPPTTQPHLRCCYYLRRYATARTAKLSGHTRAGQYSGVAASVDLQAQLGRPCKTVGITRDKSWKNFPLQGVWGGARE